MGNFLGLLGTSVILLGFSGHLTINPSCSLWAWQHSHVALKASWRDLCFVGNTSETCERMRHYRSWRETHFSGTGKIKTGHRCVQQLPSGVSGSRWKWMEPSAFQAGDGQTSVKSRGRWLEWQPTAQGTVRTRKKWGSWKSKIQLKSFGVRTFKSQSALEEDKRNGEGKVWGV